MSGQLNTLIANTLKIDESLVDEGASMQTLPQWDSLAHMTLVAALESEFKVRFEPDDLLSMVSVQNIRNTLTRLGVPPDSQSQ
jgi:acyl carrier protein